MTVNLVKNMETKNKCKTCNGYGLWAIGDHTPMGFFDSHSMPTIACPECGADANPVNNLFKGNKNAKK